jgi:hypothetical protein
VCGEEKELAERNTYDVRGRTNPDEPSWFREDVMKITKLVFMPNEI